MTESIILNTTRSFTESFDSFGNVIGLPIWLLIVIAMGILYSLSRQSMTGIIFVVFIAIAAIVFGAQINVLMLGIVLIPVVILSFFNVTGFSFPSMDTSSSGTLMKKLLLILGLAERKKVK